MSRMSNLSIELSDANEELVGYIIQNERDRILRGIKQIEEQSHATRTPIYQETLIDKIRSVVNNDFKKTN
jgi:hypothetical protein